jgi:hypothetical protein
VRLVGSVEGTAISDYRLTDLPKDQFTGRGRWVSASVKVGYFELPTDRVTERPIYWAGSVGRCVGGQTVGRPWQGWSGS